VIDSWDQALSIAISEEKSCIEQYSILVDAIRVPEVHGMFKKALSETEKHLETIVAEYSGCVRMETESKQI
jgi:rubrerythrin